MYTFGVASSDHDLEQILALQRQNAKELITDSEKASQGFVTVQHDLDLLREMNAPYPHIVCKSRDRLVGYALVMLREMRDRIPILFSMFNQIDTLSYAGNPLRLSRYFIMGQVCIEKEARGKGVFAGLYNEMQVRMAEDFDYIITEVDSSNPRSVRAHEKVGFTVIHKYRDAGIDWYLVLLPTKP